MSVNEQMIQDIVKEVVAKMQISADVTGNHGVFKDMNEAIEAAKKSQKIVAKMSMDQREKIISNIRTKIKENAETFAHMGVQETGMGNVGHKILKHQLVAEKTPGTEDITTTAWSGDRGLTLIEMGPFGVIGAITPCTNPSETVLCNTIGMLAGGNTVVFNPHPAAIKTSIYAVNMLNEASIEAGGPDNIAVTVEKPTMETSAVMMKHKDIPLIAATGGPGVVTAVLSSGKRGIGAETVEDRNAQRESHVFAGVVLELLAERSVSTHIHIAIERGGDAAGERERWQKGAAGCAQGVAGCSHTALSLRYARIGCERHIIYIIGIV